MDPMVKPQNLELWASGSSEYRLSTYYVADTILDAMTAAP